MGKRSKARKAAASGHGGLESRPKAQPYIADEADSGSDGGVNTLRIGGVVLRVDGGGNVRSRQRHNNSQQRRRVGQKQDLPMDPYAAAFTSDDDGDLQRQQQQRLQQKLRGTKLKQGADQGHGRQPQGPGRGGHSDGEGSEAEEGEEEMEEVDIEAAIDDYLANVAGFGCSDNSSSSSSSEGDGSEEGEEDEGDEGGASGPRQQRRQRRRQFEVLRRFSEIEMGDEGPVGGRGWDSVGTSSSSSEEEDSEDEDSSSGSEGSDSESDSDGEEEEADGGRRQRRRRGSSSGGGGGGSVLTEAELEKLSLAQRYPVQARPQPQQQLLGHAAEGGGRRKSKAGVKGAKGGKLAPGEKARLRKERIEAKRAARASARGFDLAWVNKQLEEFVQREQDMMALPALGKTEARAVQRLAALYGCKVSQQGGSSKKKVTIVSATHRTALPAGDDLLAVGQMLAAQFAAERAGAALDRRLAAPGVDYSSQQPSRQQQQQQQQQVLTGNSRWAGLRGSRGRKSGSWPGAGAGALSVGQGPSSGSKAQQKNKVRIQRVAFVSSGVIRPDDDTLEIVMAAGSAASNASHAQQQQQRGVASPVEEALAGPSGPLSSSAAAAVVTNRMMEQRVEDAVPAPSGLPPAAAAAAAEADVELQRQPPEGAAAAAGPEGMLEVVEDLSGSEVDAAELAEFPEELTAEMEAQQGGEEEGGEAEDEGYAHPGLGSAAAVPLYTRLTNAPLQGGSPTLRGSMAAEGITNPGRLLGLGMALGIGAEVFGAPGFTGGSGAADLSPLSPLLSKSAQRRMRRSSAGSGGGFNALVSLSPAEAAPEGSMSAGSGRKQKQQQHGAPGRKGKPGCSKAERRRRGEPAAAAGAEEREHSAGGLGARSGSGGSGSQGFDNSSALVGGDYGYFERHTTGIGSKLLLQMGWQGSGAGLGRRQHGISEPIAAERRGKRVGLGAE